MIITENTTSKAIGDPASSTAAPSSEEWQTRVDLAACYRLIARYGMTDLIYNHVTARVPGMTDQFLINSYGYLYEEVTASSLYKIDIDGNVIQKPDNHYSINQAGFVIHSAVHAARRDVGCVIHTHCRASMAVSMMECGLLPLSQQATNYYGRVGYHDYEGASRDLNERTRIAEDLGEFNVMFLRNHGLLVCGATIPEAFKTCYFIEMACKAQVDAMTSGTSLVYPSDAVIEKMTHRTRTRPPGMLEWEALVRQLDRDNPGYDA